MNIKINIKLECVHKAFGYDKKLIFLRKNCVLNMEEAIIYYNNAQ